MKSGLTIVEMAQQIERQSKLKQDYLLDTRRLQVEPFGSQLYLHTFDDHDDPLVEPLEINQIPHRQIGTHLKIPAAYYARTVPSRVRTMRWVGSRWNQEFTFSASSSG